MNKIKSVLNSLPYVRNLNSKVIEYKKNACYPPGHYYSPIVSVDELKKRANEIWKVKTNGIQGINLNTEEQLKLIEELSAYYPEQPFLDTKQPNTRYYFENSFYSYSDGLILYSMIRYFRPKRIIEVGSGFSSAVMLDTRELFLKDKIEITCIEPYPERLLSLLTEEDKTSTKILPTCVQSIDIRLFDNLNEGDFLFIDSSHVSKTGSDLNTILFDILPLLKKGVLIHFHDIFYPFEYPKEWVFGGRNWNESYMLKCFLMYNDNFKIKLFSDYLHTYYPNAFKNMPLSYKNTGANLWLEKI